MTVAEVARHLLVGAGVGLLVGVAALVVYAIGTNRWPWDRGGPRR